MAVAGTWRSRALLVVVAASLAGDAQACTRTDFEKVVEQAAAALRELNLTNKPAFQAKLAALKERRGWSHDEFLVKAAPLVQDTKIAEFDARSSTMLEAIERGGEAGGRRPAAAPDCGLLATLQTTLDQLIETQKAKWSYMIGKVEAELAR